MAYGSSDDIAYYSDEARKWKELVRLAKKEILAKIISTEDMSAEEKIRLIAQLNEVD